jgi:hypothetical protein
MGATEKEKYETQSAEAHNAVMKEHHDQKQAKLIEITKREQAPNHIHSDVEIIDTSGSTADISTLNLNRISPTSIIHVHS